MKRAAAIACALAALPIAAPALELSHGTLENGMVYVEATGEISKDDPARFVAYLKRKRLERAALVIQSDGGSVAAGITLGRIIRTLGMTVLIPGQSDCMSACAFVFAGGKNRLMSPSARLGVHQFRFEGQEAQDIAGESQAISAAVVDYFIEMGVDHRVATIGMTVPPEKMHVFTDEELVAYRLVTKPRIAEERAETPACPFPAGHEVADPMGLYPGCAK